MSQPQKTQDSCTGSTMRRRRRLLAAGMGLPLLALLMVPRLAADSNQPAQTPPALLVRVSSLDTLLDHLKLFGPLLGNNELLKGLDDVIKQRLGKGLGGIDGKRPVGFYGHFAGDSGELAAVLMVPVTGAKPFRDTLQGLGWEIKAESGGLVAVKQNFLPYDLHYRIANDYAYFGKVGQNTLAPGNLLTPQTALAQRPGSAAVQLSLRLAQVPEAQRGKLAGFLKDGLGQIDLKAQPGTIQAAIASDLLGLLDSLLKEGDELSAQLDIAPPGKHLAIELAVTSKSGSKLAGTIAGLSPRKTQFAALLDKDAAVNGLINMQAPPELRKALGSLLQETFAGLVAGVSDEAKKKPTADLVSALQASLGADELDAAFSLRGPNAARQFTLAAGLKLKQGDKLAAAIIELTRTLSAEDQKAVQLNADRAGSVAIHRIDLQTALDAATRELLGDHPMYFAFRDDALLLAAGADGLAAIKTAAQGQTSLQPPLQFEISLARLAAADKDAARAKAAQALLQSGEDGRMRLTLEGGQALRVRLNIALSAFKLAGGPPKDEK